MYLFFGQALSADHGAHGAASAVSFLAWCIQSRITRKCSDVNAGTSQHKLGEAAACAVKRTHLDERISRCAARSGADFKEGFEVTSATFDKQAGLWTVKSTKVKRRSWEPHPTSL